MLRVSQITKHFKSGGERVAAVDGVSFDIPDGRFAAIVGSSGSGKSTLLSLLGALDAPSGGSIHLGDVEITKLSARQQVAYRRSRIGFVFQQYYLVPNLTAIENVMLALEFGGVRAKLRRDRAAELLKIVGISGGKLRRHPPKLSGGEQQRVSIARALANSPELILADEPTGNLDSRNGKRIVNLLKDLSRSEGTTVMVVTHDRSIAARADVQLAMRDGRIVTDADEPDEDDD